MRRLAEAGNTAHELMAISGHKTLKEVQRYTAAADKKRLADSAMAKKQSANINVTNVTDCSYEPDSNSLKTKDFENVVPFRSGLNRAVCGSLVPNLAGCNVIG